MISVGLRKFSAFIISILAYFTLFLVLILTRSISDANIPSLAFQLGLGIGAVSGTFYAANVLNKKVNNG